MMNEYFFDIGFESLIITDIAKAKPVTTPSPPPPTTTAAGGAGRKKRAADDVDPGTEVKKSKSCYYMHEMCMSDICWCSVSLF